MTKAEMEKILNEIKELEQSIQKRRNGYEGKKMRFSYWRYEKRVQNYLAAEQDQTVDWEELVRTRLTDIISQERISMEDCAYDEEEVEACRESMIRAEMLIDQIIEHYS